MYNNRYIPKSKYDEGERMKKIRFQSFNSKNLITSCLALNIDIIASYYFVFLYNLLKSCLWIDIYFICHMLYMVYIFLCSGVFTYLLRLYYIEIIFIFFHFVVAIWLNLYMFTWFQVNTIMCELLCILGSSGNKN